ETRQSFEVSLVVSQLNVVKLLPDPARPRIYAINKNGKDPGSILVIDTLTHAILKTISVGREPTDIDLTENAAELLVMNTTDRSISRINLSTLAVTATHQLTAFENQNEDFGGHVIDGPENVLYYVDEQWGPRLRVYDTSTGTVLQTFGATTKGTSNDYGFGDIVVNPQKTALYGWVQYGDGAGWAGSFVVRYTIASNGTLTLADQGDSNYQTPMSREPYDSQALMTADGSRLVIKKRGVDLMDADLFPIVYPDDIYSMSTNGTIVATSSSLLPGTGGEVLHTLPVSATVQAILPDYSAMVYFNPTTQSITWLDLIATLGAERLGLRIGPADGATVARPERLQWFPVTGILRYQVYLGTNRSVVESATPASASYLGETANTWFDLATPPLAGQGYFWRVVPIAADGQAAGAGTTRAFFASNLTLSRSAIEAATVEGVMRHEETITLQAATPQAWSAAADVPWISFGNSSGTTPGELVARFNASSLAPGFHSGTITLTSGGASFGIPVSLRVYAANFMLAETDLELPWVYVISQENNNSTQPSFLLRINTATDRIESAVACGRSVTDLAVHYPENRVYLTNWQTGILRAFDRTTFKQVQTYQFAPVGAIGYGEGGIWRVAAGKQGRLILEEADQWIDIRLIDTANGAVIASNSTEYAGDGEADPSGRYYYHAEGTSSSDSMRRFDLAADTFATTTPTATAQGTSVVMIGDGSRVTAGSNVFNAQLGLQFALPAEVRAGTLHGDLLFTSSTAYNGTSGMEMATLPLSADLMSVTGNQEKLYLFPTNTKTFRVVDLASIAALPPREVTPTIVDGSTVIGRDQTLAWSLEPFANSYQVYFGTSRAAIDNANPTSASYLGSSSGNSWTGAQPALVLGGNYFWRVDTVGFAGTRKGVVWSFNVAPLEVTPRTLDLAFPVTSPIPRQRLALSSPTPRSWTATTSTPWIRLRTSTGSTPGSLEFDLDTAALSTGLKTGSITLQVGADTFSVPVRLQLLALNVTKLVAHPTRPVVYGINSAGTGEGFSYLLEIDAATANILRSLPIGFSPTDADLDAAGDRLYISNWGYPQTRVVNLADWLELPPLSLGSDVYKLEVSARGRIITEEQDQWIDIGMWNAATGASLAATGAREGDGETDPSGAFYYHCDSNISNAHITKYNISGDTFLQVANGPELGYGSRNLILSGNGSRLFWQSRVFDADLAPIAQMPGEVHATNRDGALAFGAGAVWWGDSGTTVGTLPFQSTVAAVSANDAQLVRFNPTTRTLHSTAISSFTDLPGPLPRPGQVLDTSPSRLWWSPVAGATDYRVFIAADHAALAAMSSPVATVSTPFYDLPSPLAFGRFYSWRVDAVTASGVTPGAIRSFTLQFPQGPALARIGNGSTGIAASISDRHLLVGGVDGTAQLYQYEPATGASSPLQNFTQPGYYWNHQFGSAVAVDAGKAAVGAYGLDNPADAGGSAFVYQAGDSNYWESSGPLSPPLPVAGESFGRSLAASGNLMLVGAGYNYQQPGRVAAYVTEPAAARLQTFSASDTQAGDGFGQVIAMEGNQALISA
ncbi:hypothetical protein HQ447_00255, partial [bacterium]|nr:hypothetical protein [bacterium]